MIPRVFRSYQLVLSLLLSLLFPFNSNASFCEVFVKEGGKSSREVFFEEAGQYYRRENRGNDVLESATKVEFVGHLETDLLFRERDILHIGRRESITSKEVSSVSLPGSEIIKYEKMGSMMLIWTKSSSNRQHFSIFNSRAFDVESFSLKEGQAIEEMGGTTYSSRVFAVGNKLVQVQKKGWGYEEIHWAFQLKFNEVNVSEADFTVASVGVFTRTARGKLTHGRTGQTNLAIFRFDKRGIGTIAEIDTRQESVDGIWSHQKSSFNGRYTEVLVSKKSKEITTLYYEMANSQESFRDTIELPGAFVRGQETKDLGISFMGFGLREIKLKNKNRGEFGIVLLSPHSLKGRGDLSQGLRWPFGEEVRYILNGKIEFQSKELVVVSGDGGEGTGIGRKNDGFNYFIVNLKKDIVTYNSSNVPLERFTNTGYRKDGKITFLREGEEPPVDATKVKLPFLTAEAPEGGERGRVFFASEYGPPNWVGNFSHIESIRVNEKERLIIWGEKGAAQGEQAGIIIYDVKEKRFVLGEAMHPYGLEKESFHYSPEDLAIKVKVGTMESESGLMESLQSFGLPRRIEDWEREIIKLGGESFYRLSATHPISSQTVDFVINLETYKVFGLLGVRPLKDTSVRATFDVRQRKGIFDVFLAEDFQRDIQFSDRRPKEKEEEDGYWFFDKWAEVLYGSESDSGGATAEKLVVFASTNSTGKSRSTFVSSHEVDGKIDAVKFYFLNKKTPNHFSLEVQSTIQDMQGEIPVLTRWSSSDARARNKLVNVVRKPVYSDSNFELFVTRATHDSEPKVFIFKKNKDGKISFFGDEIQLKMELKDSEAKSTDELLTEYFDDFLRWIFNLGPKSSLIANQNEIADIKRDGNLLFITAKADVGTSSLTYIYDSVKDSMLAVIPNFQRSLDLDGFRFFVGSGDHLYPSTVTVFTKVSNKYVTFFDFGKVELDHTNDGFVTKKGSYLYFRAKDGSQRVFDSKQRYFLGTIPPKVLGLIRSKANSVGTIMNEEIFRSPVEPFTQRDDLRARMASDFPLIPSPLGARRLLIVGDRRVGKTHLVEDYVSSYIAGSLSPRPKYRAVFLKISPQTLESNTSYRGQKAEKYRDIQEMASELSKFNYRLVLVLEDIQSYKMDNRGWDTEGDIFSNLSALLGSKTMDVIGTVTPEGRELLSRRMPDFYSLFNKTINIDPLRVESTVDAVTDYLSGKNVQAYFTKEDIKIFVEKVERLSANQLLPGSVFDVVKLVVSEIESELATRAGKEKRAEEITPAWVKSKLEAKIAEKTGVPSILLGGRENLTKVTADFREFLQGRVKGQDHAIPALVNRIMAFRLGINKPNWPIARIFAAGPTGTGKTELIVAASEFLFGSQSPRLKISGENWKDPSEIDRLKEMIISHLFKHPFNILHFDEFEKMHPLNQQIVLSILDGEITDARAGGTKVKTNMSIAYFTGNVGVAALEAYVKGQRMQIRPRDGSEVDEIYQVPLDQLYDLYVKAMEEAFLPEVRNRFDEVIVFNFLVRDVARQIIEDNLNGLEGSSLGSIRLRLEQQGFLVRFDKSVIDYALNNYVDFKLGARRLVINLEKHIVTDFITPSVLEGKLIAGVEYIMKQEGNSFQLVKSK